MRLELVTIFLFASSVLATTNLTKDANFLGIPGTPELSTESIALLSDTLLYRMNHPVDVEVLKLSPADYRFVTLESDFTLFTTFRLNQENGLDIEDIGASGRAPTGCKRAAAMCLMSSGEFYNWQSDRIAVAFKIGGWLGIYRYDAFTNSVTLTDSIWQPFFKRPIGIFSAFNQFFIVDEDSQTIFRTNAEGEMLSRYGKQGIFDDGYRWISDIDGHVDGNGVAHLYVSDGANERIDHLTATAADSMIYLESQATAWQVDTLGIYLHEVVQIAGIGVVGLDGYKQRLYNWHGSEQLSTQTRDQVDLAFDAIHIREVLGRLVIIQLADTGKIGWKMESYRVESAVYDNPLPPYPDDHWTEAMSPIYVTDSVVIGNGQELLIDGGVEVRFDAGTGILVNEGGMLTIDGMVTGEVVLRRLDYGETWHGISVMGGSVDMNYAQMYDFDSTAVFTKSPEGASIRNSTFHGNGMMAGAVLQLWNSPSVTQFVENCLITDVAKGIGFYPWNCDLDVDNLTIENCVEGIAYVKSVTGNFRDCIFKGRPGNYGLHFMNSGNTPNFQCCTVTDVAPSAGSFKYTIYAFPGTSPSFGFTSSLDGATNTFSDSCDWMMRMAGSGVKPIIANSDSGVGGFNDWVQRKSIGKYIYWGGLTTSEYNAKAQYWNHQPVTINDFFPASVTYYNLGGDPITEPWGLCGGVISGGIARGATSASTLDDGPEDVFDSLFAVAMGHEVNRQYSLSQPMFRSVAALSTDYDQVWLSLTHAVSNQRFLEGSSDGTWIIGMIDSLAEAAPVGLEYDTEVSGERLKGNYYLSLSDYGSSITVLADLLQSGLTEIDSIVVSVELLGAYVLAGLPTDTGSLDNAGIVNRVPVDLRPASYLDAWNRESQLLSDLARLQPEEAGRDLPPVPTEYRLYQNYPNPFNPSTSIEFDVPAGSRVSISIFNTLGQEVASVGGKYFPAGHHAVTWNGKSGSGLDVATGLYVYRMKTDGFVQARKMLLLR